MKILKIDYIPVISQQCIWKVQMIQNIFDNFRKITILTMKKQYLYQKKQHIALKQQKIFILILNIYQQIKVLKQL
ncbi:hypothetical protein pb186bvf_004797 [Paramecium bursaria]